MNSNDIKVTSGTSVSSVSGSGGGGASATYTYPRVDPVSLMQSNYIGLDFETYSATDLTKHGLYRYLEDPTFKVLCAGISHYRGMYEPEMIDFIHGGRTSSTLVLKQTIGEKIIVAHNVPFEMGVLHRLGLDYPADRFVDSAVVARVAGAASRLEAAAPQLLGVDKVEAGKNLMKLFSMQGKYQEENGNRSFDPRVVDDHPAEWVQYLEYCEVDAELGLRIYFEWMDKMTEQERLFQQITLEMNRTGWCVDVETIEEMQRRYIENQAQALEDFRVECNAPDLNLNSLKQMKEWCDTRGVKAVSFDEKHVTRYLTALQNKLLTPLAPDVRDGYEDVVALLTTKQILGGSSLKKLQVILDTATRDEDNPGAWRLRDQYLHCGAGQSLRTTGRSVQMQNLKRLDAENIGNMDELQDPDSTWDNTKLAENLRQGFTATDPKGLLIVGDFKSVESRGLGWVAGETWKTAAYLQGQDLYKVLASRIYSVFYDDVTKEQRQVGKVGELSCGYGAGGGAVKDFAANMGVTMTEAEASQLVYDWRDANPHIVIFWSKLDDMLHQALERSSSKSDQLVLPDGLVLLMQGAVTPGSLQRQHPDAKTIEMVVMDGAVVRLRRLFHGCYMRGRDICYYKPSDRKTGDLWRNHYIHPKTKQLTWYKLYGGKLTGILVQSLCRELFFQSLVGMRHWCNQTFGQVQLVGQFHDEIVLDWRPGRYAVTDTMRALDINMSSPGWAPSFPLAADVKSDYRYTK